MCIDDVWGRVRCLDLRCRELLLGMPVADARLIAAFERPYREGSFVPPHIWWARGGACVCIVKKGRCACARVVARCGDREGRGP